MRVELHLHTNRYSGCSTATPSEMMKRLIELGYGAVYITEHDATWSDWEIAQIQSGYPEIRIFPGLERSLGSPVRHVLVLGTTDTRYLRLTTEREILDKARDEGLLTVLAHPFRWDGGAEMLEAGLLPDALEHRTNNHDAPPARVAETMAQRYNLALVNSGDTHGVGMLGRFWVETDRSLENADDIRREILNGRYRNRTSEET